MGQPVNQLPDHAQLLNKKFDDVEKLLRESYNTLSLGILPANESNRNCSQSYKIQQGEVKKMR